MLLRIGEFARLVQLPVRTVRYYADIGLLPPTDTDPVTGYRYYGLDRVEAAAQLLTLKQLGLPLEEIAVILDDRLSDEAFRSLLEAHVQRLEDDQRRTVEQLDWARAHLKQLIERMEQPMAEITVKTSEARTIAYIREQIGDPSGIALMFPKLFSSVEPADGVDVAGNIYHHFADDGSSIDLEAVLPVPDAYQASGDAAVRRIEPALVACLTHHGSFNTLPEAYTTLLGWIGDNDYEVSGPSYEWNLVCTKPVTQDNESYVTAIEIEVRKI